MRIEKKTFRESIGNRVTNRVVMVFLLWEDRYV
jgi:hypothetical protein